MNAHAHAIETQVRGELNFGIDGIVVKVESLALQAELGDAGREPRWAIARKFAADIAETKLLEIEVNVGRTGKINPYAVLEPVEVGGTTVSRATLHNYELIKQKDLREGDVVHAQARGRRDPAGHRPGAGEARPAAPAARAEDPDALPGVRHQGARVREGPLSATTTAARGAVSRRSSTSRRAARWTSTASPTRASSSCSTPG